MQYLSFCKTESFRKLRTRAILEMQFFFFTFNSRHRKAFLFGKSNVEGKPQYKKEMFLVNFPSLHLIWDKNLNIYLTRLHWILFLTNSPPQIKCYSKGRLQKKMGKCGNSSKIGDPLPVWEFFPDFTVYFWEVSHFKNSKNMEVGFG